MIASADLFANPFHDGLFMTGSGDGGINFRTVLQILAALKLQIKIQKQSDNEGVIIDEDEEDIDLGAIANTGVKAFRRAPK